MNSNTKVFGVPVTNQTTGVTKMLRPSQSTQQFRQLMIGQPVPSSSQLIFPPPPAAPQPLLAAEETFIPPKYPITDEAPPMPKPLNDDQQLPITTGSKLSKSQPATMSTPNVQLPALTQRQSADAKTIISDVKRNIDTLLTNENVSDSERRLLLEISKKQLDLLTIILNK